MDEPYRCLRTARRYIGVHFKVIGLLTRIPITDPERELTNKVLGSSPLRLFMSRYQDAGFVTGPIVVSVSSVTKSRRVSLVEGCLIAMVPGVERAIGARSSWPHSRWLRCTYRGPAS